MQNAVIKHMVLASKEQKLTLLKLMIMKKFVFATLLCIAAMSAKAQVITSEAIQKAYESATTQPKSDFAFNADYTDENLTTMYVYKKNEVRQDLVTLTPFKKYEYNYANDGTLTSKVTYQWDSCNNLWACASRHDYELDDDKYSVAYSIYNANTKSFDAPNDKMVYSLLPCDDVSTVTSYHRDNSTLPFQIISEIQVAESPVLFAEK